MRRLEFDPVVKAAMQAAECFSTLLRLSANFRRIAMQSALGAKALGPARGWPWVVFAAVRKI
jgi:hypothetical protein